MRRSDHLARIDRRLSRIDDHLAHGIELLVVDREHRTRGDHLVADVREAIAEAKEVIGENGERFADLRLAMRQDSLRSERIYSEMAEEIRRMSRDREAERDAFFQGLGRLLGDDPPPAAT